MHAKRLRNFLIGQTATYFLLAAVLGGALVCSGESGTTVALTAGVAGEDVEVPLKQQVAGVLVAIKAVSCAIVDNDGPPPTERITALRSSIEALRQSAVSSLGEQTTPTTGTAKHQQTVEPFGPVRGSQVPPDAEELDALEKATRQTYLPGPPLQGPVEAPVAVQVEQACIDALVWLDKVDSVFESQRPNTVRVQESLRQARDIFETLAATLP